MTNHDFLREHQQLTRRFFLKMGVLSCVPVTTNLNAAEGEAVKPAPRVKPEKAGVQPEPYFTPQSDFRDVSRGKPLPHSLPEEQKKAAGLTRDTWQLEVISDPEKPAKLGQEFSIAKKTAIDFAALLKLGEQHAVRFPKVMTCLNLGCPLGMGLWEGVPLREVVWLTKPRENLRRIFYYGFHNNDPAQIFRSSLPVGRVLEDPFDFPPVILCYKLNGDWLDAERGGPVRMVVPEAYGFKSVKWLTHVVLSNLAAANDTYADQNNDVDSPLKTFAATISLPTVVKAGDPIPVSGYAQVGLAGLSKVQVAIEPKDKPPAENDPYFTKAPWIDAKLLPAPEQWSGLPDGKIQAKTHGFNEQGIPKSWPMRFTNAHWAAVLPVLPTGQYTFRCRTIDEKGVAQPLPRPFRKSGHAAIESINIIVKAAL